MMKNSNVEWIGQIPDDWQMIKIKNIANIINGYSFKSELYTEQGIKVVRITNVSDGYLNNDNPRYYPSEYKDDIKDAMLQPKDILITLTGYIGLSGIVNDDYLPAGLNQRVGCIRINKNGYDNRFLHYVISTNQFIEMSNLYSSGTAQQNLSTEWLKNQLVPDIDIKEQIKIADLLDKKCGQIDRLIEIQQQEIEKLKEYKTSVITQAVTKGLDPNVPMKDSGDLCYNNIPAIWKFTKTLNMLSMPITDGPHTTPVLYDNGIEFISAEAVKNGKIDFSLIRGYISEDFYNECCAKYKPELHDIYMIKSGATTGNVAFVSEEDMKYRFNIWSPLAVFRCKKELHYKYLYYQMQSRPYNQQVQLYWSYGTQQNIGMRVLEKLKIVVPPLKEQIEIANYIDDSIIKIDILINSKQHKIEKLQEYQKSLIYEYVTGKRRVI